MATENFDVVVIGGGPGGYVAAIRAAQLGLKTACVEKRGALGGTCLNVGCIPSKALLQSSHLYEEAAKHMGPHGIKVSSIVLDLTAMLARKEKVVVDLTKGVEFLFKQNKVTYVKGAGRLLGGGKIAVALNGSGDQTLEAKNIIIATGSDVMPLPGVTMKSRSSPPPARCRWRRYRRIWWWWAAAISGSRWVRSGAAWAPR
jgi:dihydrolipoamide dehydrogenase